MLKNVKYIKRNKKVKIIKYKKRTPGHKKIIKFIRKFVRQNFN